MMCKRVFVLHGGLGPGILAGAILVAVGVTPVRAQSSDPISPPANTVGPADSTRSSDHVRQSTEPPPFDPGKPAARAARAKAPPAPATPHATSPRPVVPSTPSAEAAPARRPATAADPWAEPATAVDPWAEPATAPAPRPRTTTRRRAEPAKVIGIDSLGHSSEERSSEPSPTARPQRGAGQGANAAPTETTDEGLRR